MIFRTFSRLWERFAPSWLRLDFLVLSLACLTAVAVSRQYDLFEVFSEFSRQHDSWELDEFAMIFLVLSVGGLVLASLRYRQMRQEYTKRVEAEQRMAHLALNDALTGLPNRRSFNQQLESALSEQGRRQFDCVVMMIDLDRFKPVNDLHGHGVGDQLLQEIARRLGDVLRDHECVARIGGDEFAVVLKDVGDNDTLDRLATRILKAVEEPVQVGSIVCSVGASIGIAIAAPDSGLVADELVKHADMALYDAKESGRGKCRYFETAMNEKMAERSYLELDLRRAMREGEIQPYYQPLIHLSDDHIEGYEILARWVHPEMGLIVPDMFIPIAEDTGMIGEMTLILLRQACQDARAWPESCYMALNISPVQLRDRNLCASLVRVLDEEGFPPQRIEIEVTESALIFDLEMARLILEDMKAAGMSLALDDFGTGYSSLHHLRELPFDKVKIDGSFIMTMDSNEESRKIVNAVIALGKSMGLKTVAEGVETEENAFWLSQIGCETGQGFYYGRPTRPAAEESAVEPQLRKLRKLIGRARAPAVAGPDDAARGAGFKRASND